LCVDDDDDCSDDEWIVGMMFVNGYVVEIDEEAVLGGAISVDDFGNKPTSFISTTTAIPFSSTISFHEVHTSWHFARWRTVRYGKMIGRVISDVVGANFH